MWRLKACPKCKGDMLVEKDSHGQYEWCLQCGCHLEIKSVPELSRRLEDKVTDEGGLETAMPRLALNYPTEVDGF